MMRKHDCLIRVSSCVHFSDSEKKRMEMTLLSTIPVLLNLHLWLHSGFSLTKLVYSIPKSTTFIVIWWNEFYRCSWELLCLFIFGFPRRKTSRSSDSYACFLRVHPSTTRTLELIFLQGSKLPTLSSILIATRCAFGGLSLLVAIRDAPLEKMSKRVHRLALSSLHMCICNHPLP